MTFLRSLLFNVFFWLYTLTLGVLAVPLLLHRPLARHIPDMWIDGTLWLLRVTCGLRVEVRGRQHLPSAPCIVASKHQSALDTLVLWRVLGGPAFILKRQLLQIPVFGWYLARMCPIAIERGNPAQALAAIAQQAPQQHAQGRHIVIFPEGTRTRPGASVRYRTGGVMTLYRSLACPIVPAALNTGCFWGRNAFIKKPGVAVVEFLPPLPAGLEDEEMLRRLQESIEGASGALI